MNYSFLIQPEVFTIFYNLCSKCAWWVYRNGFKGSILRKVHVLDYSTSVEKNDAKKIKRNFYTNDSRIKL